MVCLVLWWWMETGGETKREEMFLDPIFDFFRPKYKDGSVYVTVKYEDGSTEIKKLEGIDMNDSMGELHRKFINLTVKYYDEKFLKMLSGIK